jgi:hypothetical protein
LLRSSKYTFGASIIKIEELNYSLQIYPAPGFKNRFKKSGYRYEVGWKNAIENLDLVVISRFWLSHVIE